MAASTVLHWDRDAETADVEIGALVLRVPATEGTTPRGWHTDRTDPWVHVTDEGDVLGEDGEPTGERAPLTDGERDAVEQALTEEMLRD